MKIGCFALMEPFSGMARQFQAIRELGIKYADLTDNHDGATLGVEYGFSASVSLDSHPAKIKAMAEDAGIELTSFCAHANLLDPVSPDVYSTHQIIKAIRSAREANIRMPRGYRASCCHIRAGARVCADQRCSILFRCGCHRGRASSAACAGRCEIRFVFRSDR